MGQSFFPVGLPSPVLNFCLTMQEIKLRKLFNFAGLQVCSFHFIDIFTPFIWLSMLCFLSAKEKITSRNKIKYLDSPFPQLSIITLSLSIQQPLQVMSPYLFHLAILALTIGIVFGSPSDMLALNWCDQHSIYTVWYSLFLFMNIPTGHLSENSKFMTFTRCHLQLLNSDFFSQSCNEKHHSD